MATEEEKVLLNIDSNLDKYVKEAAEAKKVVDGLSDALDKMKKSGEASAEEIEAQQAQLKLAQQEYRSSAKVVEAQTKANQSLEGSYEKVYAQWVIAEKELKKQSGLLVTGADGTKKLSDKYVEASQNAAQAKDAVNNFNLGIHSGTTNTGLYGESIQKALGSVKVFGVSVGGLANTFKTAIPQGTKVAGQSVNKFKAILAASGIGLILLAIAGAIKAMQMGWESFIGRYDQTAENMMAKTTAMGDVFDVIVDKFVIGIKNIGEWFSNWKVWVEDAKSYIGGLFDTVAEKVKNPLETFKKFEEASENVRGKIVDAGKSLLNFAKSAIKDPSAALDKLKDKASGVAETVKEWVEPLKNAKAELVEVYEKSKRITLAQEELKDRMKEFETESAKATNEIAKLEEVYKDISLSDEERFRAAQKAREIELKRSMEELGFARQNLELIREKNSLSKTGEADSYKQLEAEKKVYELETKSLTTRIRINKQLLKLEEDIRKEKDNLRKRDLKAEIEYLKLTSSENISELKKLLAQEMELALSNTELTENEKKLIKEQYRVAAMALDSEEQQRKAALRQQELDLVMAQQEEERIMADAKGDASIERLNREFENTRSILAQQKALALEDETLNETERALILQEFRNSELELENGYNRAKKELSDARVEMYLNEAARIGNTLGELSNLMGKETLAGKAFSIAQATINTYLAATKALTDPTIPSTAARVVAMIGIIATGLAQVRQIMKVDTSGKSTGGGGVTSSPASTGFVATRSQTAGIPTVYQNAGNNNQNLLSAISALRPVVTVEEIDRVRDRKNKVEVNAAY